MVRTPEPVALVDALFGIGSVVAIGQCAELAYLLPSGARPVPHSIWETGLVIQFVCAAAILLIVQIHRRKRALVPLSDLAQRRPILVRTLTLVVVAIAVAALISTIVAYDLPAGLTAGQPVVDHGRYFLDIHGSQRPISPTQYRQAERADQQSFTAFSVGFYLASAAALSIVEQQARWRRKKAPLAR